MARKRMIDPDFWTDEKILELAVPCRLFFIGLWNFADDDGYIDGGAKRLKALIFPYDFSIEEVSNFLEELKKLGLITTEDGLIKIINFSKHQYIRKKLQTIKEKREKFGKVRKSPEKSGLNEEEREKERKGEKEKGNTINPYVDFEKSTISKWNVFCDCYPVIPKIKEMSEKRRQKLKKRFEKESFRNGVDDILEGIKEQPFLRGNGGQGWIVSFDWIIENDTNYLKILEGKYKDKNIDRKNNEIAEILRKREDKKREL